MPTIADNWDIDRAMAFELKQGRELDTTVEYERWHDYALNHSNDWIGDEFSVGDFETYINRLKA